MRKSDLAGFDQFSNLGLGNAELFGEFADDGDAAPGELVDVLGKQAALHFRFAVNLGDFGDRGADAGGNVADGAEFVLQVFDGDAERDQLLGRVNQFGELKRRGRGELLQFGQCFFRQFA